MSLSVRFILRLNIEHPSSMLHNPVCLGRKEEPCYWHQIIRSYTRIPQCQNLISQVLIGQRGFDIQFDEYSHGLSAAPGFSELQMWVNRLLSPIAAVHRLLGDRSLERPTTVKQFGNQDRNVTRLASILG